MPFFWGQDLNLQDLRNLSQAPFKGVQKIGCAGEMSWTIFQEALPRLVAHQGINVSLETYPYSQLIQTPSDLVIIFLDSRTIHEAQEEVSRLLKMGCQSIIALVHPEIELKDHPEIRHTSYDLIVPQDILGPKDQWWDQRLWQGAQLLSEPNKLIKIACHILNLWSKRFKPLKLVIVDFDDTIWGGTIADDEADELTVEGSPFEKLQKWLKRLQREGVLLAGCTRNSEQSINRAFEREMPLKREDFAFIFANHLPKSQNISKILELTSQACENALFLENSSFERAEVLNHFPTLLTPAFSNLDEDFIERLEQQILPPSGVLGGLRAKSLADNELRETFYQDSALTQQEFLASLAMKGFFRRAQPSELPRLEELFIRTNQYNLTQIRYNQVQLSEAIDEERVFALDLTDRFGDYGLIAAAVLRENDSIENWVMSCRAAGRGVEIYFFKKLLWLISINSLFVAFRPSDRNKPTEDFLRTIGVAHSSEKIFKVTLEKINSQKCEIHDAH